MVDGPTFDPLETGDGMSEYRAAVVGESFANEDGSSRQNEIGRCSIGETVELIREPDNRFDPMCVKVVSARGVQIGNISRDAGWIAERLDRGSQISASIESIGIGAKGLLGVVLTVTTSQAARSPAAHSVTPVPVVSPPTKKASAADTVKGCLVLIGIVVVLLVVLGQCSKADPATEAAKTAEDKRKGFHCLSGWDGSSKELVAAVKAQLRDPDSFEHEETKIMPEKNGKHAVLMRYRAKNGFGGVNRGRVAATIDHESCAAEILLADDN